MYSGITPEAVTRTRCNSQTHTMFTESNLAAGYGQDVVCTVRVKEYTIKNLITDISFEFSVETIEYVSLGEGPFQSLDTYMAAPRPDGLRSLGHLDLSAPEKIAILEQLGVSKQCEVSETSH